MSHLIASMCIRHVKRIMALEEEIAKLKTERSTLPPRRYLAKRCISDRIHLLRGYIRSLEREIVRASA